MSDSATAVLFDIDGTLVDSNFLHVEAWDAAFSDLDLAVPSWRILRSIGADSSQLLDDLIGDQPNDVKDRAKELHSEHYAELGPRLRLLPGARELLEAVGAKGSQVVLATSSPPDELERLQKVLDVDALLSAITSGDDVDTAKPAPDVIGRALEKAGVDASSAVMVGDAVWDVRSASAAGVATVSLRSGGTGTAELTDAGAVAVYDDAADLLHSLDTSPLARLWR